MRRLISLMSCVVMFVIEIPRNCLLGFTSSCVRTCSEIRTSARSTLSDNCRVTLAAQNSFDGTFLGNREYDDRHTVFTGKRESRAVHHLQILLERFLMADFVVPLGLGVLFRIRDRKSVV